MPLFYAEPLNDLLVDKTTYIPNHPMATHLGCVLLRCTLGCIAMLVPQNKITYHVKIAFIVISMIVCILFGYKYFSNSLNQNPIWKVYMRTTITYAMSALLIWFDKYSEAGMLMTVESLMGLQSRHMAYVASAIVAAEKKISYHVIA